MSESSVRLEKALQEMGILAKKSLGQNFLVSDLVIERIINQVKAFQPDELIEVGPGPGALTYFLRQMNVPLQLIELDRVRLVLNDDRLAELVLQPFADRARGTSSELRAGAGTRIFTGL